jgi:hypothetical protein
MRSSAPFPPRGRGGVGDEHRRGGGRGLAVAVIGSVVSYLYANDLSDSLAPLPPAAQDAAQESIGAAGALARGCHPRPATPCSRRPATPSSARWASGLTAGAALAIATAVVVARLLPGWAGQGASDTRAVGRAERRMAAERGAVL